MRRDNLFLPLVCGAVGLMHLFVCTPHCVSVFYLEIGGSSSLSHSVDPWLQLTKSRFSEYVVAFDLKMCVRNMC